jgi:hypothetical protein
MKMMPRRMLCHQLAPDVPTGCDVGLVCVMAALTASRRKVRLCKAALFRVAPESDIGATPDLAPGKRWASFG